MNKVDNFNLAAKLELRRYFLKKYHAGEDIRVFDCCQGDGVIWNTLKKEFQIFQYWGVDKKKKKGRLQIDSVRVVGQKGLSENVIDVDTYGSPWKHYEGIVKHICQPISVFLTIGQWQMGTDKLILRQLGLTLKTKIPPGIACKLHDMALPFLLLRRNLTILEALESPNSGSARYIGLRLLPLTC